LIISLVGTGLVFAQQDQAPPTPITAVATTPAPADAVSINQVIDKIIGREAVTASKMRGLHPLVETYLQSLDKDDELAFHPVGDRYFLGELDFNAEEKEQSLIKSGGIARGITSKIAQLYSVKYLPGGFVQMLVVNGHFDKKDYTIEYVRREFLGQVRTLVFDVIPKKGS